MKKIISVILVGMMMLSIGCASTDQKGNTNSTSTGAAKSTDVSSKQSPGQNKLEEIKKAGKMVVGTSADYPPYEFHAVINGKDEIVGFDIEVAKEIAKGIGVELEIQDMGFDAVLAGVGTGLIDIGVAGINPSPEREKAMDFSKVYYKDSHTILIQAQDAQKIQSIADLKGKTVGAQIGTVQENVAKEEIKESHVKSLPKVTDLVLELKTGMLDAIILEIPVAESYAKQNSDLMAQKSVIFEKVKGGSTVITAKNQPELMDEINKIIEKLIQDGKIDAFVADANKLANKPPSKAH